MPILITILTLFISSTSLSGTIEDTKEEIKQIALLNMTRTDNYESVRAKLDPLVASLSAQQNLDPQKEKELKLGGWKQLWTDDADDTRSNNFFTRALREQTYQVIFEDGFFYNISTVKFLGVNATAFLRGQYQPRLSGGLDLEFDKLKITLGATRDDTQLVERALALEEGKIKGLDFSFLRDPAGPVGAKGFIRTVYIDEDLRIDLGYNLADEVEDLFVLVRQ